MHPQTDTSKLSPAQRAWITRRAKMATTAVPAVKVEARPPAIVNVSTDATLARPALVKIEPEMVPVDEFRMVEFWVDDQRIGCGRYRFIVLETGDRTVRLFNASKLAAIIVSRKDFDKHHATARKVRRQIVADIIRRNIAIADRVNANAEKEVIPDGGAYAQRALELLGRRS